MQLQENIDELKITRPECIANMDEKGFLKGRASGVQVLVERREDGSKGDAGVEQGTSVS